MALALGIRNASRNFRFRLVVSLREGLDLVRITIPLRIKALVRIRQGLG
jgi:hypothetical protein